MSPSVICVARIGAAHGVRGAVKLWTFSEDPLAVKHYGPLMTRDGARQFEVTHVREAKDHLVATLKGIATREEAKRLDITVAASAVIYCATAGERHHIADAPSLRDALAEFTVLDLPRLDRPHRGCNVVCSERRRRHCFYLRGLNTMRFTRRQIVDLLGAEQVGMIALDAGLEQFHHHFGEADAFMIRRVGALLHN